MQKQSHDNRHRDRDKDRPTHSYCHGSSHAKYHKDNESHSEGENKYKDLKKKTKDVHWSYTHGTYTYRDKDFDCDEYTKKKSKYKGGNHSHGYDHYDKQRDRDHHSVISHVTVAAHNQKEKNQKAMIIISMPIEQVSLIWIQPVITMVNGIKASIGTINLIMMVIVIIQIQNQISNLPATGLTIWIEIEIMKTTVRITKETLQMDVLLDKNTKETTNQVMKATAMTFHPAGPSEKERNTLMTKVMTKVMPTKGMRSISIRKVLRNVMAPKILMRGFLAFVQVTTKVMKKGMPMK